jgi:hypothetical protein
MFYWFCFRGFFSNFLSSFKHFAVRVRSVFGFGLEKKNEEKRLYFWFKVGIVQPTIFAARKIVRMGCFRFLTGKKLRRGCVPIISACIQGNIWKVYVVVKASQLLPNRYFEETWTYISHWKLPRKLCPLIVIIFIQCLRITPEILV